MRFMDGTSTSTLPPDTQEASLLTANRDVTRLHRTNTEYLSQTNDSLNAEERARILEEIYLLAETEWLRNQPKVKQAISERGLQIHAFVYDKMQNQCVRLVESRMINGTK
jgi:carbonic anhydrase